jgi:hypothetical protein
VAHHNTNLSGIGGFRAKASPAASAVEVQAVENLESAAFPSRAPQRRGGEADESPEVLRSKETSRRFAFLPPSLRTG